MADVVVFVGAVYYFICIVFDLPGVFSNRGFFAVFNRTAVLAWAIYT